MLFVVRVISPKVKNMPSGKKKNNQQASPTDDNLQISLPLEIEEHKDIMSQRKVSLAEILKDSNYKLSQFSQQEINSLEQSIFLKQTKIKREKFLILNVLFAEKISK